MRRNHPGGGLGSVALVGFLVLISMLLLPGGLALAKHKKQQKERLRSLEVVYVTGSGAVTDYVKRNLEKKTCLRQPTQEDEGADAVLEVEQRMMPCRWTLTRACLSVTAKLLDPQTHKVLWFRSDDEFGSRFSVGVDEAGGKWVLWNVSATCCKGR